MAYRTEEIPLILVAAHLLSMSGLVLDSVHMALALHLTVPLANPLDSRVSGAGIPLSRISLGWRSGRNRIAIVHLDRRRLHDPSPQLLRARDLRSCLLMALSSARETELLQILRQLILIYDND
jgi:hypothetical protein